MLIDALATEKADAYLQYFTDHKLDKAIETWCFAKELGFLKAKQPDVKRDAECQAMKNFVKNTPAKIATIESLSKEMSELTWMDEACRKKMECATAQLGKLKETIGKVALTLSITMFVSCIFCAPEGGKIKSLKQVIITMQGMKVDQSMLPAELQTRIAIAMAANPPDTPSSYSSTTASSPAKIEPPKAAEPSTAKKQLKRKACDVVP